jgi:hypothetical protein
MSQGQYPPSSARNAQARSIYAESGDVRSQARSPRSGGKKSGRPQGKFGRLLARIPYGLGIALCVVILAISLLAGNARALSSATGEAMQRWQVQEYVSGRIGEARNLLTLCDRYGISAELTAALSSAADQLASAGKDIADTVAYNQQLETAASNVAAALLESDLSGADEKSLARVMDDFREQGNFLRQQAREYNQKAQDALALYNKLPTRFLLKAPEIAAVD